MKRYRYTEREAQIIQSQQPMPISNEDFLSLYHKAFMRDDIKHINHLGKVYPEIESRVFSDEFMNRHCDPADREYLYPHPILCPTNRYTIGRIKDIVCYLTGGSDWSNSFRKQLCATVPYRLVFNYWLDEYVKDYDVNALWEAFCLGQEELSSVLELRRISSLDVLAYRAREYYDRDVHYSCAECRMGDRKGAKKPHRKVCSKNGDQRIFSGLGVPTSGMR